MDLADLYNLSDASREHVNEYFDPTIDPTVYRRFKTGEAGAGIRTSGNLAASFDQAILAGLGLVKPPEISNLEMFLYSPNKGGLGAAAANAAKASTGQSNPELEKTLASIEQGKAVYNQFKNHPDYKSAFSQLGINLDNIKTRADLDKIDPKTKERVFDIVQQTRQQKNQIPKSGIFDSIPGQLALGLAGLIHPGAAVGLGAIGGGLSGEGGIPGAIKGAVSGYGLGSLTNQFTSTGTPAGIDPRDVSTPDRTPGGRPAPTFDAPGGSSAGGTGVPGGGDVDIPGGTATSPPEPPPAPPPPGGSDVLLDGLITGTNILLGTGGTNNTTSGPGGTNVSNTGGTGTGTGTGEGEGDSSGNTPNGRLSLDSGIEVTPEGDVIKLPKIPRKQSRPVNLQLSQARQPIMSDSLRDLIQIYPSLARLA